MAFTISGDFDTHLKVINSDGLKVNLSAALERAKKEIRRVVGESAIRVQVRTIDLCPKDTFFMSEHVRADFSPGGYKYTVGWDANDFVGTEDENGRPRPFYPPYVEFGTRKMRAQPSLSIAFIEEEPRFKANMAKALSTAYARGTRHR